MPDLFGYRRTCELESCQRELDDKRRGARFCCQAHQVEHWKQQNAERRKASQAAWRAAHPGYKRRWRAARRAKGVIAPMS